MCSRTLRHVAQYSPLLDEQLKKRIANPGTVQIKQLVAQESNPLSELPLFLSGKYTLDVPVYTVWGACEDVRVLEKFRSGEYKVQNLHIIDEASSRLLDVGGVKLRLLGLGGAVVMHKLFDNGEGKTTIAGGQGTMWTTLLQMGELVDTAVRVYDPTETRIFITHNSPAREGLLNQLSVTLKADFSISAGLHFRYGSSYNEFSVNPSLDHYRGKLASSHASFNDVWETVKGEVEPAVAQNAAQKVLLENALKFITKMPTSANGGNPFGGPSANAAPGAGQVDESAFKNMWNFNLADAAFGWLVLEVEGGRIGTEMKAQGFNFAHRGGKTQQGGHHPAQPGQMQSNAAPITNIPSGPSANTPISPAVPLGPGLGRNKPKPSTPPTEPSATLPAVPLKPASPRPAPTGPANRTATPGADAASAAPSNGAPAVTTEVEAAPALDGVSSPKETQRVRQHGLYVIGVPSEEAVREIIAEEDLKNIKKIDQKSSTKTKNIFFLVHMEDDTAQAALDHIAPEHKIARRPGTEGAFVKLMDDREGQFTNYPERRNDSRAGINDSRWSRGTGNVGGNTSESDNPSSGGYKRRGRGGGMRGQGSFERGGAGGSYRGRGGPRGGRGGAAPQQSE